MEVACEVEIDFLHRQHLRMSAACSTALHAEAGSERRLTQRANSFLAKFVESEGKADTYCCLTDASLCRGNGCDKYKVTLSYLIRVDEAVWHLGYILAMHLQLFHWYASILGHVLNVAQFTFASN